MERPTTRKYTGVAVDEVGISRAQAYATSLYDQARDTLRAFDDMRAKLGGLKITMSSRDRLVTVTVGPYGELLDLQLDPRIYRTPDSPRLAATIRSTVEQAQEEARHKVTELGERLVPEATRLAGGFGMDLSELLDGLRPGAEHAGKKGERA